MLFPTRFDGPGGIQNASPACWRQQMNVDKRDTELNRIRVDHVGGLPRPAWLRDVQARYEEGNVSAEELEAAQRQAVGAVIGKQEELGLPILTDGEFTRHNFQESFGGAVTGFDAPPAR